MNFLLKLYCIFTRFYSHLIEDLARLFLRKKLRQGLVEENDIVYRPESKQGRLDYCYRRGGEKKPVFIYIHGGGFVYGKKETRRYYCRKWAEKGFFTANINYDFTPEIHHPEQLKRIFQAIEKVLDSRNNYYLDTDRIILCGDSAGGYYSSFVAAISKHRELYDTLGIDFKYRDTFDVKGTVLICGIYDLRSMMNIFFMNIKTYMKSLTGLPIKTLVERIHGERAEFYNPICSIDKSFPPSFIISAKHDTLKSESFRLEGILNSCGVECRHFICDGLCSFHTFALAADTRVGKLCLDASQKFVFENVFGIKRL